MCVAAAQAVDMHGRLRVIDEALKEFPDQVDIEIGDASAWVAHLID